MGDRKDADGELAFGAFAGAQINDEGFEDTLRSNVEGHSGCLAEVFATAIKGGDVVVNTCLFEEFESGGSGTRGLLGHINHPSPER